MTRITEQLQRLKGRIGAASAAAGRDPASITILAVSKRHSPILIQEAADSGLQHFGENYVQEAVEKQPHLADDLTWHFIGRIQSNKTRLIAENFDWTHTVSTERIAARLSAQRPDSLQEMQVCLQVQPENATDRSGIDAAQLPKLAEIVAELPRLRLRGLMIIPLPNQTETQIRTEYAGLRRALIDLQQHGHAVDTLSMGMSSDLEAAIMEGSTMLRIGTALFGQRDA